MLLLSTRLKTKISNNENVPKLRITPMIRNFAMSQRNLVVASLFFSLCVHIRYTHHGDFSTDLIVLTIGDICVFAVAQCLSLYSFPLVTSGLATANGQKK